MQGVVWSKSVRERGRIMWSQRGILGGAGRWLGWTAGMLMGAGSVALAGPITFSTPNPRVSVVEGESVTLQWTLRNTGPSSVQLSNDPTKPAVVARPAAFSGGDSGNRVTGVSITNLDQLKGQTIAAGSGQTVAVEVATTDDTRRPRPVQPKSGLWTVNVSAWSQLLTGTTLVEDVSTSVTIEIRDLIKAIDLSGGTTSTSLGPTIAGAGAASVVERTLGYSLNLSGPRVVTGLGFWDEGDDGIAPHEVGLWDNANGQLLAQAVVDNSGLSYSSQQSGGAWIFQRLLAPVLLDPGQYVLGAVFRSDGTDAYRTGTAANPLTLQLAPGLTFGTALSSAEGAAGTGLRIPTEALSGETGRFGPILLLEPLPVPEPGVGLLAGLGLVALLPRVLRRPRPVPQPEQP